MNVREYAAKITVTPNDLANIQAAQQIIYNKGIVDVSTNYASQLSVFASVLGLAFVSSTPVGIVTGVSALVLSLIESEKDLLESMVIRGYWDIGLTLGDMKSTTRYDIFEVSFPFIHYYDCNVRFITGKGYITKAHVKGGGWETF